MTTLQDRPRPVRRRRPETPPTRRAATPLDLLLADAARSPLRRFVPGHVRACGSPPAWPATPGGSPAVRRGSRPELAKVGVGSLRGRPAREGPPLRRGRLGQEPVPASAPCRATWRAGEAVRGLVDDADLGWGDGQRMSFIVDNLVEASAPSNNPFLNPKVLKRVIDTGGGNLVEGGRRLVARLRHPAAGAVDGRARRLRGGRRPRGHPGRGGAAHRRLRADPVHPARPPRSARCRC